MENQTLPDIPDYLVDIPYLLLDIPNFDNYKYDPILQQVYKVNTKYYMKSHTHHNRVYLTLFNNNGEKDTKNLIDLAPEGVFNQDKAYETAIEARRRGIYELCERFRNPIDTYI